MPAATKRTARALFADEEPVVDLKWYVIGAGLTVSGLLASYSQALGIAAGVVLAVIMVIRVSLYFWLAPEKGAPASERDAKIERFRRLSENRFQAHYKSQMAKLARSAASQIPPGVKS